MHCDGQIFFGVLLADYVLVEIFFYCSWGGQFFAGRRRSVVACFLFCLIMSPQKAYAVGADIDFVRTFDEGVLLGACSAAEGCIRPLVCGYHLFCHWFPAYCVISTVVPTCRDEAEKSIKNRFLDSPLVRSE